MTYFFRSNILLGERFIFLAKNRIYGSKFLFENKTFVISSYFRERSNDNLKLLFQLLPLTFIPNCVSTPCVCRAPSQFTEGYFWFRSSSSLEHSADFFFHSSGSQGDRTFPPCFYIFNSPLTFLVYSTPLFLILVKLRIL